MRLAGIGLAMLLLAAFFAAGAASAEELKPTVLCDTGPESGACKEEDIYAKGKSIQAKAKNVSLSTTIGGIPTTVTCEESVLKGKTVESVETLEQDAEVSSLTFSGCKAGLQSCTVEAQKLPYEVAIDAESPGKGRMALWQESGETAPGVRIKCSGLGFDCVYETSKELNLESAGGTVKAVQLQVAGGSTATATATEAPFVASTPSGGNCLGSKEGKLAAKWEASEPSPLFVEVAPFGFTVNPEPIVIAKVGNTVTVHIENTGAELKWKVGALGVTAGKLAIVEIEGEGQNCSVGLLLKPGEKCKLGLECLVKGAWTFLTGWDLPASDVIGPKLVETKCEV